MTSSTNLAALSRPELEALTAELSRSAVDLVDMYLRVQQQLAVTARAPKTDLRDLVEAVIVTMTAELDRLSTRYTGRLDALKLPAQSGASSCPN